MSVGIKSEGVSKGVRSEGVSEGIRSEGVRSGTERREDTSWVCDVGFRSHEERMSAQ